MTALPEMTRDDAIRDRLSKRVAAYSATGKIALLNVGAIRQIRQNAHNLDVPHAPTRSSPCHAVITGVSDLLALTLAERLADLANDNAIRA